MKTVLVFTAPDILVRDVVLNKLHENTIATYGSDTSINVVYPNTPNLYLGRASAIYEGYRILVEEENAEKAKELIAELQLEVLNPSGESENSIDHGPLDPDDAHRDARLFHLVALLGLAVPLLPLPFALFYFVKAVKSKQVLSKWKTGLSVLMLLFSLASGLYLIAEYLNHK